MQETRYSGEMVLTSASDLTSAKRDAALANPDNQSVAFHRPGSIVTTKGRREYQVQPDGSWKVLNKPISKRKRAKMEGRAK